ncbi:ribosome maturation factor RimM [Petrotoga sibirica]|uniref:Ribosome maturation factor RimM n=1 Tax=Petrotoga sibirica TaxID=156202 RepID=A0A4R8EQW1_9BACT|nr:ribosome maturation factor RimM [Petrotoga sibirica]TDX14526.1 16S rRNA processing protein RimM [Petrotoga sibirica]
MSELNSLSNLLDNKISVAKIVNSHGVHGEVKVVPFTNIKSVITNLEEVLLYNTSTRNFFFTKVLQVKPLNRFFVLNLRGIVNMDEAKKMIGYEVFIDKKDLPPLKSDEYYWYEILSSDVYYENGEYVGKVEEIIQTGANDVISIKNIEDDKEVLIPMTDHYIVELKKEDKSIIVKKIEWYENGTNQTD